MRLHIRTIHLFLILACIAAGILFLGAAARADAGSLADDPTVALLKDLWATKGSGWAVTAVVLLAGLDRVLGRIPRVWAWLTAHRLVVPLLDHTFTLADLVVFVAGVAAVLPTGNGQLTLGVVVAAIFRVMDQPHHENTGTVSAAKLVDVALSPGGVPAAKPVTP